MSETAVQQSADSGGVPRAPLNRVDHTALRVTDLDAAVTWYERALDMNVVTRDDKSAMLNCGVDERVDLVLHAGGTGIASYALGIDSVAALETLAADLKDRGIDARPSDSTMPGIDAVIELTTPSGHLMQVVASSTAKTGALGGQRPGGVGPVDTDHVTMLTPDVKTFAEWLGSTFGFATSDAVTIPGEPDAWMSAWTHITPQHHDVALLASPEGTLHHTAFLAADLNHMGEIADRVCSLDENKRCEWGIGKHGGLGANNFLYFQDPSGNRVEVNSNMERHPFEVDTVIYPGEEFLKFISIWNDNPPPDSFTKGT